MTGRSELQGNDCRAWTIMTTHMRRGGDGSMIGVLPTVDGPGLDEPLVVVPLSVAENLAAALEHITESSAHPSLTVRSTSYLGEAARKALAEYRAAYPAKVTP